MFHNKLPCDLDWIEIMRSWGLSLDYISVKRSCHSQEGSVPVGWLWTWYKVKGRAPATSEVFGAACFLAGDPWVMEGSNEAYSGVGKESLHVRNFYCKEAICHTHPSLVLMFCPLYLPSATNLCIRLCGYIYFWVCLVEMRKTKNWKKDWENIEKRYIRLVWACDNWLPN